MAWLGVAAVLAFTLIVLRRIAVDEQQAIDCPDFVEES